MTGPKVSQPIKIQLVSIVLHVTKVALGLFCLQLNTIV